MRKNLCTGCKERFNADTLIALPAGKFHSYECATSYGKAKSEKLRAKAKKIAVKAEKQSDNKRKKEFKLNDIPYQHKLTQIAFNRMRVLQELSLFKYKEVEPECISCGKTNMDWCCGHYKTVGAHGRIRYDEKNTYLQCNRYCNMALSGNISGNKNTRGFKEGLIARFEKGAYAIFKHLDDNCHAKKWTGEELESMRKEFNAEIKLMEKELC